MILRIVRFFIFAVVLLAPAYAFAEPPRFIPGLEDVPMLSDASILPDQGFAFDAPSTRVVEVYLATKIPERDIYDFYARTLPELGWQPYTRQTYVREDERLTILIDYTDAVINERVVRFLLSPHTAPERNTSS